MFRSKGRWVCKPKKNTGLTADHIKRSSTISNGESLKKPSPKKSNCTGIALSTSFARFVVASGSLQFPQISCFGRHPWRRVNVNLVEHHIVFQKVWPTRSDQGRIVNSC